MREAIQTALQWVMVLAGIAVTVYRLVDLIRSPKRPAMWAMWSGLLLLTLCVAVGMKAIWTLSAPQFLVQHLLILGSLEAFTWFYLLSIYGSRERPAEIRWYQAAMYLLAAGMVVTWGLSVAFENPDYLDLDYAAFPLIRASVLCYTAATGVLLLTLSRLSWKWSRIADRVWLRRSLVTLTISTGLGLLYTAHHLAYTLLEAIGITPPYPQGLEVPVIAGGVLAALIGLSMPVWGPRVTALRMLVEYRRSYRELEPLWQAFTAAQPAIALEARPPKWDSEFALYRRAIEIMDGRSRLRAWLDPEVAQAAEQAAQARGLEGAELVAAVEAEVWRHAIAAHAAQAPEPSEKVLTEPATGNNLAAMVQFLRLVAAAWQRPPLIPS
ncbi:MAB_1171c family putative transporter [Amycolatopsis kentuckyensis]|uniref:MAB_1171c family putative transporter n=1 Tax=Amycolatopsis kentuckyensis TaxID=218823 RepID=UPI003562C459